MPHPSTRLVRICTLTSALLLAPIWAHAQDAAPVENQVAPSGPIESAPQPAAPPAATLDAVRDPLFSGATAQYDLALQDRVNKQGLIDYAKLKDNKNLAAFVAALPTVDVARFPVFEIKSAAAEDDKDKNPVGGRSSKSAKAAAKEGPRMDQSWELSFWINAQNGLVLKTLSDAYPIGSPDDVKDLNTRKFAVAGGQYTLAEIRERAAKIDRRALFAMIDGTQGGPKMAPRALRAYGLNETLESAVSALVNDNRLVELQRIQNRVSVPPFFTTVDAAWAPRNSRRKWDGIRNILSSYTDARANRSYFTTNNYEVLQGPDNRKLNVVPSAFAG